MSYKSAKIYLTILFCTSFVLFGCNNGNNINPIKNTSDSYNQHLSHKNTIIGAAAAAAEGSDYNDGQTQIFKIPNGIRIVIEGRSFIFTYADGQFPEGEFVTHVILFNFSFTDDIGSILVITNTNKLYQFQFDTADYNPLENTLRFINTASSSNPEANFIGLASDAQSGVAFITDGYKLYLQNSNHFTSGYMQSFYIAPRKYIIDGIEYLPLRQPFCFKVTRRNRDGIIKYVYFDSNGKKDPVEQEHALGPATFPQGFVQSRSFLGFNGGGGGSGPADAVFAPPAASDLTQPFTICPTSNSGNCYSTQINSEYPIVDAISNYQYVTESGPIALALNSVGDVYKWNSQTLQFDYTASLAINIGINAGFYSAYNGMFYVIGSSTNPSSIGNIVIMASEDGKFWQNSNIYGFGKLATTGDSYCGIENDSKDPTKSGQVYCWGNNSQNKLGLGETQSFTPARALIPNKIGIAQRESGPMSYQALAGGNLHMCALRSQANKIDCWGAGELGQLGDGITHEPGYSTPIPTTVNLSGIDSIQKLVAGGSHSCILVDGQANCWGSNTNKEIDASSSQTIFTIPTKASYNEPFSYTDIAAGADFTCAMSSTQINCWGNNYSLPYQSMTTTDPYFTNFMSISAAGQTACVLSKQIHNGNTNAWCFGDNTYGQLGIGKNGGFYSTPQQVISKVEQLNFVNLYQSGINTCGLTTDGQVYCWGDNQYGQTGIPDSNMVLNPQAPMYLNQNPGIFMNVSVGMSSICLISTQISQSGGIIHNTYCLGKNDNGQLGIASTNDESKPSLVNQAM